MPTRKHIFRLEDYPDSSDNFLLDSETMKAMIRDYSLLFREERYPPAENARLPAFVKAFQAYVADKKTIPTQADYYTYYLKHFATFFESLQSDETLMSGIEARIYRTYPSLVRETIFIRYVKENLAHRATVLYNRQLDIGEGIDLMISVKDHHFAISLYVETKNGKESRVKKHYRHTPFENVTYIDFSAKLSELERCGVFYLYGNRNFENLKQLIRQRFYTLRGLKL